MTPGATGLALLRIVTGAIALVAGLFTRPLGLLILLGMLGVIVLVRIAGGGAPSLDAVLAARRARER